jgi:acyl-CoA thioester hydrolase
MKHAMSLRVYYEDTDVSGRVYHASYLRFIERGRTEWLRARGFEHRALSTGSGVVFAVRGMRIEFLAPAFLDDMLSVETLLAGTRGAIIQFKQFILREMQTLVEAEVRVVTLRNGRAVRPPRELLARLAAK